MKLSTLPAAVRGPEKVNLGTSKKSNVIIRDMRYYGKFTFEQHFIKKVSTKNITIQ